MADSTTFVYTMNRTGQVGAWSRYVFPFSVDAFAQLGDDLYIRHGDEVSRVVEGALADEVGGVEIPFDGVVQWHWLDAGQPGVTKMLEGFDVVGSGSPSIQIGYDQRNVAALTDAYAIEADTMAGGMIPFPISAPSMSVKLTFAGGTEWSVQSVNLYLHDFRAGS